MNHFPNDPVKGLRCAEMHTEPRLVALRRKGRAHPELAFGQVRTAGVVTAGLVRLGSPHRTDAGRIGVLSIVHGDPARRRRGASRYRAVAADRVVLVVQPAEEALEGAEAMISTLLAIHVQLGEVTREATPRRGAEDLAEFAQRVRKRQIRIGAGAYGRADRLQITRHRPDERGLGPGAHAPARVTTELLS